MPDAGIDAEKSIARRDGDMPLDGGRLAAQAQQVIGETTGTRHLVHDAAWCAGDVVLRPLRREGNLLVAHTHAVRISNGGERGHFERRGRTHAFPFRHAGFYAHPETARGRRHHGIGAKQARMGDAEDIRRPMATRVGRQLPGQQLA